MSETVLLIDQRTPRPEPLKSGRPTNYSLGIPKKIGLSIQSKLYRTTKEYKEYHNICSRKWARKNKDKILKRQREWLKTPNGKLYKSQKNHNRKALLRGAIGKVTARQWEAIKKENLYTCLICGKREPIIKLTRDHVIPISKGGSNLIDNIQPLCQLCNSIKSNKYTYPTDYKKSLNSVKDIL